MGLLPNFLQPDFRGIRSTSLQTHYLEILQRIREEEPKPSSTRLRRSTELKEAAALQRTDSARLRSVDTDER